MDSFWTRSTQVLFSADPKLRVRSSMALLAVALMTGCAAVMLWLAHMGFASITAVAWWACFAIGGLVVMALLIRLRVSALWRDPALTSPQILWAITCSAVAYVLVGEARGVVPGLLAVTLLFAALNLKPRQIVAISLYAMSAFGVGVVISMQMSRGIDRSLEAAYAAVLCIMLMGCMLLSLQLYQLRMRLNRQRQELAAALEANRELASRDSLTGLLNRRHMLELMHLEQRRCLRGYRKMLLAQMDIDHFKLINDTYGHAIGDLALQTFAEVVRENIRSSDVLCRWGGEEFVLLLSDTELPGALMTLNRVRAAVSQTPIKRAPMSLRMTVSIGVAEHIPGEAVEATLDRADKALYCAKRAGRDQVVVGERPNIGQRADVQDAAEISASAVEMR